MGTQSAENYLDELLNSVKAEEFEKEQTKEKDAQRTDAQPEMEGVTRNVAKAEAEFLMEFERELAGENYTDVLNDFEANNILQEDRLSEADVQFAEDVPMTENTSGREEISLEELARNGIEVEEVLAGEPVLDDTIDLSQMEDEDLISLLAETEDLSDIGQILEKNDSNIPIEGEDPFASYAKQEMAEQEESRNAVQETTEKSKKVGFFAKLSALLFGKEEEPEAAEPISLMPEEMPGVVELSDENAQILSMFEEVDHALAAEQADSSKKNDKKKEKKKKEPKPKKEKKPKAPKPKKEKKPKEKDDTPPLPKGPVALVCVLAVSIFVLVFWGSELISYSSALSKAKAACDKGNYSEAAEAIAGVTIREEDAFICGKISTLAAVHSQLEEYEVFIQNDKKAEALDSLISAAGRCELNEENTMTFDCADEMQMLKNKATKELEDVFGLTYEKALELYDWTIRDRAEYTRELHKIYEALGIEIE